MPTLEELDGHVWNEPDSDSHLVRTCHELRKKRIEEFTAEDLRIMIGQDIGLQFLMPGAVALLENDPLAEGDCYPGDLLSAVASADPSFYSRSPEFVDRVAAIARNAIVLLNSSAPDTNLVDALRRFINRYWEQDD